MHTTKLTEFLDSNRIKYISMSHSPAYTSQEVAASAHISGRTLAKSVMLIVDNKIAMAVLPANYKIKFEQLKKSIGANEVRLAYEIEFKDKFPDCEVGAMPPFGNLYGMPVYVSKSLSEAEEIAFNACSHKELIKMSYKDFEKLVKPVVVEFTFQSKL